MCIVFDCPGWEQVSMFPAQNQTRLSYNRSQYLASVSSCPAMQSQFEDVSDKIMGSILRMKRSAEVLQPPAHENGRRGTPRGFSAHESCSRGVTFFCCRPVNSHSRQYINGHNIHVGIPKHVYVQLQTPYMGLGPGPGPRPMSGVCICMYTCLSIPTCIL